jgi:hypothetical protein
MRWVGALALLWAGMVLGVSFLASPVKFSAPHLSMPVALEVGRITFAAFNRVQAALALALLFLLALGRRRAAWLLGAAVVACWAGQTFWLLPALHPQTNAVIQGGSTAMTPLHLAYVGSETLKLLLLGALGVMSLRR